MKIEFIKETKSDNSVRYFTNVDNNYMEGSLTLNEADGLKIYEHIKNNKGTSTINEILKSEEI